MKANIPARTDDHPLFQIDEQVERQGLVVIDITSQPQNNDPYISPYVIVALCQQGTAWSDYDMMPVEFHTHDMTFMHQGHIVKGKATSPDYRARFIVMSAGFFERFKQTDFARYHNHVPYYDDIPACHLNDEQYRQMNEMFNVLQTVCMVGNRYREEMAMSVLRTLVMLRYEFHPIPAVEQSETGYHRLSDQFKEAVIKHFHESHKVSFYAHLFSLSPKYFSTLIKAETGISASEWIENYVTLQAKTLLTKHRNMSVQQTAELLGFSEQAAFSRFFKHRTGLSPTEYRNQ